MPNSSFFDEDEDDFYLPDGGDTSATEADSTYTAPVAPARPVAGPQGNVSRPLSGSSVPGAKPPTAGISRPSVVRPAPMARPQSHEVESGAQGAAVEPEEIVLRPAPARQEPVEETVSEPEYHHAPEPVPARITPVAQRRTIPEPPISRAFEPSQAPTQAPAPALAPVEDTGTSSLLAGYEANAGTGFNPFADATPVPEKEESFLDEVKPEDLSPTVDPEEVEAEERKKKSMVSVRRAKKKDAPAKIVKTKKKDTKAKGKKGAKVEDDESEDYTRFSGKRNRVMVATIASGVIIALLAAGGVKQFFFPNQIPGPDVVTSTVSKNLGITKFPEESANGFVTSFVREYLTVNPETVGDKGKRLGNYTSDALASTLLTAGSEKTKISVAQGPYISGVESIDDNRAVYTVAAQLSDGGWTYLKVPVYFDSNVNGFSIYEAPSFTPKPQNAALPTLEQAFQNDSTLAEEIKEDMTSFFTAWGSSEKQNLERNLTNSASIEARTGLEGAFEFGTLDSLKVEKAPDGVDPATVPERKAIATVTWLDPDDADVMYRQTYDLVLFKQPDNRWYVKDIDVSVNSAGGS